MSLTAIPGRPAAASAFDGIAERYDDIFTNTVIGRAQRTVIWNALSKAFSPGNRVLELNCGTGEDALFLARHGASVLACDASPGMIAVAQRRQSFESPSANVNFQLLSNEHLYRLHPDVRFDGAFSNFSGLNCSEDTQSIALNLGKLVRPGGRFLLCVSSRFCLWEIFWFLSHGSHSKAFRRISGRTLATVQDASLPVWYPTVRQLRKIFAPWFTLNSFRAVGLFVPPSYVDPIFRKKSKTLALLSAIDSLCARLPLLRSIGDHVLLEFERLQP